MDDFSNGRYTLDSATGLPNSGDGVFYPDPADSTKGGLGLQMAVRTLAFHGLRHEDLVFFEVDFVNAGATTYDNLFAALYLDMGLGWEQGDENAAFGRLTGFQYAWDHDGIGQNGTGGDYSLGYVGLVVPGDSPGLTGTYLSSSLYYSSGDHLLDDGWIWKRIVASQFVSESEPNLFVAGADPAFLASSGPRVLAPGDTTSLSAVLVFGDDDRDLSWNRDRALELYEAGYRMPVGVGRSAGPSMPDRFSLAQNYPNPFNPTTTVTYDLPAPSEIALSVFDVLGRKVRLLASGAHPAGTHQVRFDASGLPSGIYFCTLRAGRYTETRRMVLLR
jgi:hypothetical protein